MADKLNSDFIIIYNNNKDELLDMKDLVDREVGLVNKRYLNFRLFSSLESLLKFVWLECENCPYMILNEPSEDPQERKHLLEYLARKYGMTHMIYLKNTYQEEQESTVTNQKNGKKQPLTIINKKELVRFLHKEKSHMGKWFQFVAQTNQLDLEDRKRKEAEENSCLII